MNHEPPFNKKMKCKNFEFDNDDDDVKNNN